MTRSYSLLTSLFPLTILLAGFAIGQQQPPKQMTMEVSIVATGKDNAAIEDLTEGDLTVKDNGKKQDIVSFTKVTAGDAPAEQGKPGLYNIVLLDALNTTYSDLPYVRIEILKTVAALSKASNVTFLMLRNGLTIVSDPGQGASGLLGKFAAQGVGGLEGSNPNLEPYAWVFKDELGLFQLFTPAGIFDRRRIENSLGALQTIAKNYHGRSGRKNLYWISQGFPMVMGQTPQGYSATQLAGQSLGTASASSGSKGTSLSTATKGTKQDDLTSFDKDMEATSRLLNNANMAIYPIDSRALAVDNMKVSDKGTMSDLARETGGMAYTSRKDIAAAMSEALADTRVVYVMKYAITDLKVDGKFHEVKLDSRRKDVRLRYRNGFYAPLQGPASAK